jgi:GNAT superfamily N-acetyltransferase
VLNIRDATSSDVPLILQFIRELAEYEEAPEQAVATAEDLLRHGFSAHPKFRVLIAEWQCEPAAFALFFYHYSTWLGRPTLFLEDLFVRPRFRGKGIGKTLLLRLAKIAISEGCGRFEWQVLDWNTPAIKFYQSLGAEVMKEWLTMRVSGEGLLRLASQTRDESRRGENRSVSACELA